MAAEKITGFGKFVLNEARQTMEEQVAPRGTWRLL